MRVRPLIQSVLLLLLGASLLVWALDLRGGAPSGATSRPAAPAPDAAQPVLADGVAVLNFHGTRRCKTCVRIGELAEATVRERFGDELRRGRLQWLSLDYDLPQWAHCKQDYGLVSSNVVVVRRAAGQDAAWQRLDQVWDHAKDEPVFRRYVGDAIAAGLAALPR